MLCSPLLLVSWQNSREMAGGQLELHLPLHQEAQRLLFHLLRIGVLVNKAAADLSVRGALDRPIKPPLTENLEQAKKATPNIASATIYSV